MTKKITKILDNGGVVTKTVDPKSNAACGIPAPSPKSGANKKLILLADADYLESNRVPPQAQAILYSLSKLKGSATQREICDHMESEDGALDTVQSPQRIMTFYRKKLIKSGHIKFAD
jgi:hypothetical protein